MVGFALLLQKAHQCAKDSMQADLQSHPSGCTVGMGQRHTSDAVPNHCSFQTRLQTYRVWHSMKYKPTTTKQHPQY